MKKLTGILLTLILTTSLTACGSSDPASIYASAAKKYHKADGVAMVLSNRLTIDDGSSNLASEINGAIKIMNPDGEETRAAMEGSVEIDMGTGTPMVVPISYYYTENNMYANMTGTQYKTAMSWENAAVQMGPGALMLMNLEAEDFQEITMLEDEEQDQTTLSFIISADRLEKVTGAISQWDQYAAIYGDEGTVSFRDVKGSIVVKDGYPINEELVITGTLNMEEESVILTSEIEIQVTTYENVEVNLPDLGSYQHLGDVPVAVESE